MINYLPNVGADVNDLRKHLTTRIDIHPDDIPLLDDEDIVADHPGEIEDSNLLGETMSYSPAIGDFSSVTVKRDRDITNLNKENPSDESLLQDDMDNDEESLNLSAKDMVQFVPSAVVDYYNETALSAKQRNKIPDEDFGLPRLRAYPLNDRKHVLQAIRMFHHCKDPKDRKTLAGNIFKKVKEYDMDVTVGKNNDLYEYAPKQFLQESATIGMPTDGFAIEGLGVPRDKRSKDDIIKEHLRVNSALYNQVFYNPDYAKSVSALEEYNFLDYFYPNFKSFNLYTRLKTCLGGMGMNREVYSQLKLRYPLETDKSIPLGNVIPGKLDDFNVTVGMSYDPISNWYSADLSEDLDHILYCLRLYSILGYMTTEENFRLVDLGIYHVGILTDWIQKVQYHYDLLQDEREYSKEYIKQCQYLHDLCWSPIDDPMSIDVVASCAISFAKNMATTEHLVANMNESKELFNKENCKAYLIKELGFDDDMFLLPSTLEYPIINKDSIRLAMDNIRNVDTEQIKEYTKNLNRKYREFGCTFKISVDHPYAQYADKAIINNMIRILTEAGGTGYADQGTASSTSTTVEDGPWYQSLNYFSGLTDDFYPDRNLGPNDKKNNNDVTRHDSLM